MEQQKERIKKNHTLEVLKELESQLEPNTIADKDAPVRACYRYIKNRSGQFDYAGALASNLPIGSGEIESGHRVHSQFFVNYLTTRRIFSNFLFLILSWSSLLYFSTILS